MALKLDFAQVLCAPRTMGKIKRTRLHCHMNAQLMQISLWELHIEVAESACSQIQGVG